MASVRRLMHTTALVLFLFALVIAAGVYAIAASAQSALWRAARRENAHK
jgi:hypothetical protein